MSASNGCEACGWMAAFGSALAFGTFAVPIKSNAARSVNIDPLVFQSYKTSICFLTSWLILLSGKKFVFTPWGIVSGLFWVPGGIATIYAVKTVGLGLGIGIASSMIVLISFSWGIFVFREPIHSKFGACIAILSMIFGLIGMSYYSTPMEQQISVSNSITPYEEVITHPDDDEDSLNDLTFPNRYSDEDPEVSMRVVHRSKTNTMSDDGSLHRKNDVTIVDDISTPANDFADTLGHGISREEANDVSSQLHDHELIGYVLLYGYPVSKRHLGMLAAAFCGLWGGSIMAPMKFCKADTKGTHYLLSFAIGSAIVNVSFWLLRYAYGVLHYRNFRDAYSGLPSFHFRKMWLMGGISGILWSIGNFFSLISVFYLGEGVGYPLVQTSILISGLWGLFYFKEVHGSDRISRWLLSSLLTVFGILLLSYEHHVK